MDTGIDFISPEFLNILFFQQKNLIIFPYVDLKHLHFLELFTVGYNVINLDSTALHNLKEILEFETNNNYSQNPTLFFIYNVDKKKVKEIMDLKNIHCVINSNENIADLVNGSTFIFFNKKNKQFLNYDTLDSELEFEQDLISSSKNKEILQDKIQKIKIAATRIFTELNQQRNLNSLPTILKDYKKKHWHQILQFTGSYYDIKIPDISTIQENSSKQISKTTNNTNIKDFSDEYEIILSSNKYIGKEFIQLLLDYRTKRVNPAHLEIEQFFPNNLYNYLRNHHWKDGIPEDFVKEWVQMNYSQYALNESDKLDFESILEHLGLHESMSFLQPFNPTERSTLGKQKDQIPSTINKIPSIINNLNKYKQQLLTQLEDIGQFIDKCFVKKTKKLKPYIMVRIRAYLLREISAINILLGIEINDNKKELPNQTNENTKEDNHRLLLIDITNIISQDIDQNKKVKVNNIKKVGDVARSKGFIPKMIADASMRHHVDNLELYEELIEKKIITQAPAASEADEYVLEYAKSEHCKFLANDKYKKYWGEFGKDWIFQNHLTCLYLNGNFIIRQKNKKK